MIELTCRYCGETFQRESWDVKRGRKKYCSLKCYYASRKGGVCLKRRRRIIKLCLVCNKAFETGGRAGKRSQLFCSAKCARLARFKKGSVCNRLKGVEASYIAGFLDGEGSIMIVFRKPNSYYLRVVLAQSLRHREVLDWVSEVTGIGASVNKNSTKPEHDTGLTWACNSNAAYTLLKQLLPYLIVKKEQTKLAMKFCERLRIPSLKADRSWQVEYKEQMGILNARGKNEISFTAGG